MKNFTLFVLVAILSVTTASATNYNNTGTNTTYQLYAGDTLRIKSGTYTGNITVFNANAVIIVEPMAIFKPIAFPNSKGTLINNGTMTFSSGMAPTTGFSVTNFSRMQINGDVQLNGLQTWTNKFGATMEINGDLEMNMFSIMINEGTLNVEGNVDLNLFSSLTNKNLISTEGSYTVNYLAEFVNEGETNTEGMLTFQFGSSFTNNCRMITDGGFTNNSYSFTNLGLLWVGTTGTASDHFINNGTFINGPNGYVRSVRFTNNGSISGAGKMYFMGHTINYGTIGVTGSTADSIKVYDVSRTSPTRIFDVQYGSVRPNVAYRVFADADTTAILGTCSNIFKSTTPLPIKYTAFFVNLSDNTPVLNWASQQTAGTMFQIQRSYDGRSFTTIETVEGAENKDAYKYEDKSVNTEASVVYYRIMGVELTGMQTVTEVRMIKFSSQQGVTIQVAPNPFTSQFSIQYQSSKSCKISIRLFNMSGQLQASKMATITKGFNSISVTGVAELSKGIYLLQVMNDNEVIATQKIVKN